MPPPLFPAELFVLIGINIFVALSLLTSIFDHGFPRVLPYLLSIAALAGFGQIWLSYTFFVAFVEARFWVSTFYLVVALITTIAVNLYIAINKRSLGIATALLGAVTIPAISISFLSVSAYVNGLTFPTPPLPIVPAESIYIVLVTCVVTLGFSIFVSVEPGMLRKILRVHRKRWSFPICLTMPQTQRMTRKKIKRGESE